MKCARADSVNCNPRGNERFTLADACAGMQEISCAPVVSVSPKGAWRHLAMCACIPHRPHPVSGLVLTHARASRHRVPFKWHAVTTALVDRLRVAQDLPHWKEVCYRVVCLPTLCLSTCARMNASGR
jgi:hypothetical protein